MYTKATSVHSKLHPPMLSPKVGEWGELSTLEFDFMELIHQGRDFDNWKGPLSEKSEEEKWREAE